MTHLQFQSFIDIPLWDKAGWKGVGYLVMPDESAPPCIGFIFENNVAGKQIFTDLRKRVGEEDYYEEIRVSIIEGDIPGELPGYSVHISSDPIHTVRRAKDNGQELTVEGVVVVSRVHRMNPNPNSPHLSNFKKSYQQHGKYLLIPMSMGRTLTPHFDFCVGKREIHFRNVQDVVDGDRDAVIFSRPSTNDSSIIH